MTLDEQIYKDVFFGPFNSLISPLTPVSKMVSDSTPQHIILGETPNAFV